MITETKMFDDGTLVCYMVFDGGGYTADISLTKDMNLKQIIEKPITVVRRNRKKDKLEYTTASGNCGEIVVDGMNISINGDGGKSVLMGAIRAIDLELHPPKKKKRKPKKKNVPSPKETARVALNRFLGI